MPNVSTYNQLIERFRSWANAHEMIKAFGHGQVDNFDTDKLPTYPIMFVSPDVVTYETNVKVFSIQVIFADLPKEKDDRPDCVKEVLSDTQQLAEDLIATLVSNASTYFGDLVELRNPTATPFIANYANTLTGWVLSIGIAVPYQSDFCSIPSTI